MTTYDVMQYLLVFHKQANTSDTKKKWPMEVGCTTTKKLVILDILLFKSLYSFADLHFYL